MTDGPSKPLIIDASELDLPGVISTATRSTRQPRVELNSITWASAAPVFHAAASRTPRSGGDHSNPHLQLLLSDGWTGGLAPAHRADLEQSGLTKTTIALHRLRSVPLGMIRPLLGFLPSGLVSAMVIPYPNPTGGFLDHIRMKIFPPLTDRSGHTVKYLQPRGSAVRLYLPIATTHLVLRDGAPLWTVEGEKKALAASQLGVAAVGIAGVEGWHAPGSHDLGPDWNPIPLRDRQVELAIDADVWSNPAVARATRRLAEALRTRGAKPRLVILPEVAS